MTLLRLGVFCIALLLPEITTAGQGVITGWDPPVVRQTLTPGTSNSVSLTFSFDNTTNAVVNYIIFVQDNSGCPKSQSSHSWIAVTLTPGSIPLQTGGEKIVPVPLNTDGPLPYGSYVTNVCFVGDESTNPTNVAVPVVLKSVPADDIFLDGLE